MARGNRRSAVRTVVPTREDLAYAAGLFDGEGCVNLQLIKGRTKLAVCITNSYTDIFPWLEARFGGLVYRDKRDAKWKASFRWVILGNYAVPFLTELLPYLRIKQGQAMSALIAMQFAAHPREQLTPLQAEAQDLMNRDVRWLNTKGPVETEAPILQFRDAPHIYLVTPTSLRTISDRR